MEGSGVGYRLRYLSGGVPPTARVVGGKVVPERAGYYLGHRMIEAIAGERGLPAALRASATECRDAEERALPAVTAPGLILPRRPPPSCPERSPSQQHSEPCK